MTTRASIEAHLLSCGLCIAGLAAHARVDSDGGWQRIGSRVAAPHRAEVSRPGLWWVALATRRLCAVTALLSASILVGALVVGSDPTGAVGVFVVVFGPLAPAAVAALAYTPWVDPVGVAAVVSPMADRLPFVRALIASMVALTCAAVASPWCGLGSHGLLALCLPAIAIDLAVIASARWTDPRAAAAGLSAVWAVVVAGAVQWHGQRRVRSVDLASTHPLVQLGCLVAAMAAAALVAQTWRQDTVGSLR